MTKKQRARRDKRWKLRLRGRPFEKKHTQVGARPGQLIEHALSTDFKAHWIQYSATAHQTETVQNVESLPLPADGQFLWLDIRGLGNQKLLQAVGEKFEIHPLALADAVNVPQRPKCDSYDDQLLIVNRMARLDADGSVVTEQVTLLLGASFVISFQEIDGDILDPVRKRLADPKSMIRKSGVDFLAYAIMDAIIDGYYPVVDVLGEQLEQLELRIIDYAKQEDLVELNRTKNLLTWLRRGVSAQREAIGMLIRDQHSTVSDNVKIHLRDVLDHSVQVFEVIEMYREMASGLTGLYMSSIANRSNEVMKVLTVVASIFTPLTFLAGIYGMNFEQMPELKWRWGYPLLLVVMMTVAAGMLFLFWRKGWLGREKPKTGTP